MTVATKAPPPVLWVYIGTYTGAKSQGIYRARFDTETGHLGEPELAAETINPIFLGLHPNGEILYATSHLGADHTGRIEAYAIEPSGKLNLLDRQSSSGVCPCHLAVDSTGKCVLVANYLSGNVAAFPVQPDGRFGGPGGIVQHRESGPHPCQTGPRAHFISPDSENRFALACDLGADKVSVCRFDPARGLLEPNHPPGVAVKSGSGPRHLAFHPGGKRVYLINEIASTLVVFAYEPMSGILKELQTLSTLPEPYSGINTCAHVLVHPSGRFVYGSNRGHDSITVFAMEADSGELSLVGHHSSHGKSPRHFALDPSGRWLLAENQDTDNIVVFRVDAGTGWLTATGQEVKVGSPVCVLFAASH
jgi:6-phosphogluconolactonase